MAKYMRILRKRAEDAKNNSKDTNKPPVKKLVKKPIGIDTVTERFKEERRSPPAPITEQTPTTVNPDERLTVTWQRNTGETVTTSVTASRFSNVQDEILQKGHIIGINTQSGKQIYKGQTQQQYNKQTMDFYRKRHREQGIVPYTYRKQVEKPKQLESVGITEREYEEFTFGQMMGSIKPKDENKVLQQMVDPGVIVSQEKGEYVFTKKSPIKKYDSSKWAKSMDAKIQALYKVNTGAGVLGEIFFSLASHMGSIVEPSVKYSPWTGGRVIWSGQSIVAPKISSTASRKLERSLHFPTVWDVPLSEFGLAPKWSSDLIKKRPIFATTGVVFEIGTAYGMGKMIPGGKTTKSLQEGYSKTKSLLKGTKLGKVIYDPGRAITRFKWINKLAKGGRGIPVQFTMGERILLKSPKLARLVRTTRSGITQFRWSHGLYSASNVTYKGFGTSSFKNLFSETGTKGLSLSGIYEPYKVRPGLKYRPSGGWGEFLGYKKPGYGVEAGKIITPGYYKQFGGIPDEFLKFKGDYIGLRGKVYPDTNFIKKTPSTGYYSPSQGTVLRTTGKTTTETIPLGWRGVYDVPTRYYTISKPRLLPVFKPVLESQPMIESRRMTIPQVKLGTLQGQFQGFDFRQMFFQGIGTKQVLRQQSSLRTDFKLSQKLQNISLKQKTPRTEIKMDPFKTKFKIRFPLLKSSSLYGKGRLFYNYSLFGKGYGYRAFKIPGIFEVDKKIMKNMFKI